MKRLFIAVLMILSITTAFTQTITTAEYFFDTDPGPGNGTPTSIGTPGMAVSFPVQIPINLSPGFHWLGIRVKDSDGKWSLFQRRNFYVTQPGSDLPIITKAEYFFDNDPGVGNGSPLSIQSTGFSFSQVFPITVPSSMSAGTHRLAIRVRDQAGHWSLFQRDTIVVDGTASISCPANVSVSAASGQCSAIVNNIDPTISPQGSSYTYTLSGATTGNGTGTASGKTFNTGVTTVTYSLSSSPSINCSFTVTVNSTVVPSVTINANNTSICTGGTIVFTALPTNGGNTPHYQWKQNGIDVGTDSVILQTNQLNNGDVISVVMTSSIGCANPVSATSNSISVTVTPPYITPTINITASSTSICSGTPVTFIAYSTNGGSPWYSWNVNNVWIPGPNSDTFNISTLAHGDRVKCVMTASLACVTDVTTVSNEIQISVVSEVVPEVNIASSATTICSGTTVTFTAIPTNGGTTPVYQWQLNGNNIPNATGSTYQSSTLNNGDIIEVLMTSSLACTNSLTVISNPVTITVTSSGTPSVTISTPQTTVCAGSITTFTAMPVNGGMNPTYQWKVNDINAGNGGNIFETTGLVSGDVVKVVMTTSLGCASSPTATSNSIQVTVLQSQPAYINIAASSTTICSGAAVTFTTSQTGGGNPTYQWKLNGNDIPGATGTSYQTSSLQNGDKIKVVMTSSLPCAFPMQAGSNEITMTVNSTVTPSVTINASATNFCYGTLVTFNATPTNGANPTYEWKVNGHNVGANANQWQVDGLLNGDTVTCTMTSNACGAPQNVTSNMIIVTVQWPVAPAIHILPERNPICIGNTAKFTATPTNGGDHPSYQWKLNGANVGSDSSGFSYNTVQQGDWIQVFMTSSLGCVQAATIESNLIQMRVDTVRTYYRDNDGDWYGNTDSTMRACRVNENSGWVINSGDCNDNDPSVNPEAIEICSNSIDDDCDGQTDENCTEGLPILLVKTHPVKEGDVGYTIVDVEVKLDKPATLPISVNYATSNANATAGSDYVAANGTLSIHVGAISGTIQIKVIGDLLREGNESFWLGFSNPVNVVLGSDPRTRVMIIDDDKGKPTSASPNNDVMTEAAVFKIPTIAKRNTVWMIPQISNYENEVLIVNVQGQVVNRFLNYKNQSAIANVAAGLYFYRIGIKESSGQYKYYSGRLLVTE